MGASNSTSQNIKFYSLKAKVSESDNPNFSLTEKVNDSWEVTGTFNTISGRLNAAEMKEKEYNGSKFNTFILTLDDDTEVSKVEFTHNAITHSLINSLASNCNKLDMYNIQVYKKQSKGNDGKTYWNGGVSIKVGDSTEGQKWHIDPQSAPKREPVMTVNDKNEIVQLIQSGKPVWKHDKERAFWEDVFINKIQNVLKSAPADNIFTRKNAESEGITKNDNPNLNIVLPADEDDLPF